MVNLGSNVAGVLTAIGACAASAAITVGVAAAAPLQTGNALITSTIIAVVGLVQGRRMSDNAEPSARGGEPSVAQDPNQRRIDQTLAAIRSGAITPDKGMQIISMLRDPRPVEAPPYGTPKA